MREPVSNYQSIKVNEGLYAYIWQGMGNNCNTCLFPDVFSGDKPHLLIDPGHINNGFSNSFEALTFAMGRDGYKINHVGMIIDTHSHSDHCQSNTIFAQSDSVAIAMSEEEEKFRQTLGKKLDTMFGITPPVFKTTRFLKEGELELGDKNKLKLQVFITPGHSPGSVCLYLPGEKILITGDVVFNCSVGRTDFPGGDIDSLQHSIERLSHLDVNYIIPGHSTEMGNVIEGKKNVERNFQAIRMFFG